MIKKPQHFFSLDEISPSRLLFFLKLCEVFFSDKPLRHALHPTNVIVSPLSEKDVDKRKAVRYLVLIEK